MRKERIAKLGTIFATTFIAASLACGCAGDTSSDISETESAAENAANVDNSGTESASASETDESGDSDKNTGESGGEEAEETVAIPTLDHTLQDIVIFDVAAPSGLQIPTIETADDGRLYFMPASNPAVILLRDWAATDISAYKENGYITMEVMGSGSATLEIGVREMIKGEETSSTFTYEVEDVPTEWTEIQIPFTDLDSDLLHVRAFVIGLNEGEIYVSNIRIVSDDSEKIYPAIKVNEVGYKTDDEKTAIVSGYGDVLVCRGGDEFEVVNADDDTVVYTGELTTKSIIDEAYSGEEVLEADFSELTEAGTYYLRLLDDPDETSVTFEIEDDVYDDLLVDTMRYFYYQRANEEITEEYGEGFTREDVTPEDYELTLKDYESVTIDASGGWYDAGDIGKYVSPGATAANTLLWAYKLFPENFSDGQNNIPESENGIPDILDEIKYELDFILRMQDEESGGFYMKVKSATENDDANDRVVWEYSTNSTADCVAVTAFASTIFREFDSEYADELLAAALHGWDYITENPDYYVSTNYSGEDNNHATFWAAGSLFYATGDQVYGDYVEANYEEYLSIFGAYKECHSVGNMAYYGYYCYLLADGADSEISSVIAEKFDSWMTAAVSRYTYNPWDISLSDYNFWWGSFNMVLGTPQDMLVGCYVLGEDNATAMEISKSAIDFILGENPLDTCFVTGYGENAISCTFSNFWGNQDSFPSGYMPGGINSYNCAIVSRFPMKCYVDEPFDWVTNENAIYWNAVLVFNVAANS